MNISVMNVKIKIQKNDVTIDKIGNHLNDWVDYYSCYATVSGENGGEKSVAGETVDSSQISFTVRFCNKVSAINSTNFRIVFNDEIYNILLVDHFSYKKQAVKFKCEKVRR